VLYLAYMGHAPDLDEEVSSEAQRMTELEGPWVEVCPLADHLLFVDSDHSRSAVYHALKDHLPRGAPLLVAACDEIPKLKGMAPGALAWARDRVIPPSAR
jgi:hypothetical protein